MCYSKSRPVIFHLIIEKFSRGRYHYYFPFTAEETEAQQGSVTSQVHAGGETGIWIPAVWLQRVRVSPRSASDSQAGRRAAAHLSSFGRDA